MKQDSRPPLRGVKVLDFSLLLPGPLCSMYLGDMGAEVLKVENPRAPDMVRLLGDKISHQKDPHKSISSLFLLLNRNKKSITVNIKRPEGQKIILQLLKDTDVLLEGFRPNTLNKLGLGYPQLKEKFPKLIYCAISGYGSESKRGSNPYLKKAGHDANYIATAGLLGLTGSKESGPIIPGFQVADVAGGSQTALSSILAALYAREKTGKGQFLDISMTDGAFSLLSLYASEYITHGTNPQRGNLYLSGALPNYRVYKTSDKKYLVLAALEKTFFSSFLKRINRLDLIDHINFLDYSLKAQDSQKLQQLHQQLEKIFNETTSAQWQPIIDDQNCCLSLVNTVEDAFNSELFKQRKMAFKMPIDGLGEVPMINSPHHFVDPKEYTAPPHLSQDTQAILEQLGYSETDQNLLKNRKIIL